MAVNPPSPVRELEEVRRELFALCEETEEREAQNEFDRGRIYEAKGLRRAMGEIIGMMISEADRRGRNEA